jgi:NAD(P)-dependent dehydrogenase (short-subunit alcohol dehydrogenase family)
MKNVLIVGSSSRLAISFMKKYESEYEFYGIDCKIGELKIKKENFFRCNIEQLNYNKLDEFLGKINVELDVVLFCQGVNFQKSIFNITNEEINSTFEVNVMSSIKIVSSIKNFIKNAVIIFYASQNGIVGHEDRIDYGSSKAAIIQLTKNLAIDFSKHEEYNSSFYCISPGYIDYGENIEQWATTTKLFDRNITKCGVNFLEIVDFTNYLISSGKRSLNGHNFILDNGYTIR